MIALMTIPFQTDDSFRQDAAPYLTHVFCIAGLIGIVIQTQNSSRNVDLPSTQSHRSYSVQAISSSLLQSLKLTVTTKLNCFWQTFYHIYLTTQSMTKRKSWSGRLSEGGAKLGAGGCTNDYVVSKREYNALFEVMFVRGRYERVNPFSCAIIVETRPLTNTGTFRF